MRSRTFVAAFLGLAGVVGCIAFPGCGGSDSAPAQAPAPLTYERLHATILKPSCAFGSCHAGSAPAANLDFTTTASCANLKNVTSCVRSDRLLVVPSAPDESYLYAKVIGKDLYGAAEVKGTCAPSEGLPSHMPPTGLLGAESVDLVRGWIAIGAPCPVESDAGGGGGAGGAGGNDGGLPDAGPVLSVVSASFDKASIPVGDRANLTVTLSAVPAEDSYQTAKIEVSDATVLAAPAAVSFPGDVTKVDMGMKMVVKPGSATAIVEVLGLKAGTATVMVSNVEGGATATAQITVTP